MTTRSLWAHPAGAVAGRSHERVRGCQNHGVRIATWNVNSLPARLPRLLAWLAAVEPDVLVLQETKIAQEAFPTEELAAAGYESVHRGQGRWNGVALLSRVGIADLETDLPGVPGLPRPGAMRRRRATSPRPAAGVRVAGVYVPNGRTPQDPHFEYKLAWLDALAGHLAPAGGRRGRRSPSSATSTSRRPTTTSGTSPRSPRAPT